MPRSERFENLVLGSGAGGKLLAWEMARSGRRTAVVERRYVGGSCPNINCLPSKNEIWSAKVAHLARHGAHFGVRTGPVTVDMTAVRERKRGMVEAHIASHRHNYAASGAELIMGEGRFVAPKTLEVQLEAGGTRTLTADRVFINVGTHAALPDVPGLAEARPMTNIEALELDCVPSHLVVLGGGYVGLELGQAYVRFGSRVTVIDHGPQLLSREDPDVAQEMQRILESEGMRILLDAKLVRVEGQSGRVVRVVVQTSSGEHVVEGSDILVAAGRVPNTAGIGLDLAGVELDDRGYVRVDERLRTTAADVWAIGECAGSPQFTHVSADDFRVIADDLAGGRRSTRDRLIPYCMFTDPPLARVGLGERDASARAIDARVVTLPMRTVLRTSTIDEQEGFMKALVGSDTTSVSPDGSSLDSFYLSRNGADEIQLDLFGDYQTNVALYPTFQEYFRTHRPRFLAAWGRNDPFFLPSGAEAFLASSTRDTLRSRHTRRRSVRRSATSSPRDARRTANGRCSR